MTNTDRSEVNRALAKAIAYLDCGKPDKAEAWAVKLMVLLRQSDVVTHEALRRAYDPE